MAVRGWFVPAAHAVFDKLAKHANTWGAHPLPEVPTMVATSRLDPALARGARVFKALGQPTRLFLIQELGRGPRCVRDLQALVGADMSTVSKHLAVLREAGLVRDERRGNQVVYHLAAPCVLEFMDCVARVTGDPVLHDLGAGAPDPTAAPAGAGGGAPVPGADGIEGAAPGGGGRTAGSSR